MKRFLVSLAILAALPKLSTAELQVVATLTETGALVQEIGGERVVVSSLARGDEDPHSIAAKPSHSRRMSHADLLVANGLELEIGWLPLLIEGARNPRILPGRPGNLDLSSFIAPLEVPETVDRSQGDVHPEGNPHYTLDPGLYPVLARAVQSRLSQLDPAGDTYYQTRLKDFLSRWDASLQDWLARLAPLRGMKIVAYHRLWIYNSQRFGYEIAGYLEDRPGIPPAPRHIAELEQLIRKEGIRLLIYSDLDQPEPPEHLASRAGCKALCLPQAVGSRDGTGDLFAWFEQWVGILEDAVKEQ